LGKGGRVINFPLFFKKKPPNKFLGVKKRGFKGNLGTLSGGEIFGGVINIPQLSSPFCWAQTPSQIFGREKKFGGPPPKKIPPLKNPPPGNFWGGFLGKIKYSLFLYKKGREGWGIQKYLPPPIYFPPFGAQPLFSRGFRGEGAL